MSETTAANISTPRWQALEVYVEAYVAGYEMRDCEDDQGNAGDYTPTEGDRAMIIDAIQGLLADEKFAALMLAALPPRMELTPERAARLAGLLNAAAMKIFTTRRDDPLIPQLDAEVAALSAVAAIDPRVESALAAWLARELPAGTSIHNPDWWAPRLLRFIRYAERAARG